MKCTCSDNLHGRIGYCPVHEGPRGRCIQGVSIWNTISPYTAVLVWGFIFVFAAHMAYVWIWG